MEKIENSKKDEQKIEVESVSNTCEEAPKVKKLRGWYIIVIVLVVVAGATFLPAINLAVKDWFSSWDIFDVGNDLLEYAKNNNQQFPAAEKWCDTMLEKEDDYYSFKRYEDSKENFPYTLNKNILGHNEIPENMVVLFSGASGWNQVGGIDLVKNHDRLRVFFGNGDVRTFRKNQIPHLRWNFEDSGVIPDPNVKIPFLVISALLAIVFLSILIACRKCLKIFWILALGMGIISAGAGAWLGGMAEEAYYKLGSAGSLIAPWIGGIWGFVIGVSFIVIIGKIYKKYNAKVSMLGYATVIGAITGIVTSSIVHGYLMISYEEESFSYILACSCFGIIAGVLLGWITSGLIRFYKSNPAILNITTE